MRSASRPRLARTLCAAPPIAAIGGTILGVVALAAALGGCGRDERPGDPAPIASGSSPALAAPPPAGVAGAPTTLPDTETGVITVAQANGVLAPGSRPSLTVLEPGAAPLEALAYSFEVGKASSFTMGMRMRLSLSAASRALPPTEVPRLSLRFDVTPVAKADSGEFEIEAIVREATVTPRSPAEEELAAKMGQDVKSIEGVRVHYFVSADGAVRDVDVRAPEGAGGAAQQTLGQMTQSFESMVAPLPKTPVGVGARWMVVSRNASSRVELAQWATYRLVKREGNAVELALDVKQLAVDSAISSPNMPAGATAKLARFQSRGDGDTRLDLGRPTPVGGTMRIDTTMTGDLQAKDSPGMLTIATFVETDFEGGATPGREAP